jgi:tetratricopeptide (TPR) repeat protein
MVQRSGAFAVAGLALMAGVVWANDGSPDALIDGGHWKRLAAVAEQRLRANPNDARANYWMAFAKFEYRDYDGAEPYAEKAVALDGKNADYHFMLGAIAGRKAENSGNPFSRWGLARKVKREFDTAASLDPRHVRARLALIDFHLEAPGMVGGDKKLAYQYADEILRINAARGWLAKARIARKEKQTDQLESLYVKAVEADGRNYAARMALAGFYAAGASPKLELVEKHAREAVGIDAGRAGAYGQLAALYAHQQRWKELDAILAQAEKSVADNLSPYFFAARNLALKGVELARAERYLRKYLGQAPEPDAPSHAQAHWRLGNVVEKLGRTEEACREYREAVRLDGKLEEAKKDLKRVCK